MRWYVNGLGEGRSVNGLSVCFESREPAALCTIGHRTTGSGILGYGGSSWPWNIKVQNPTAVLTTRYNMCMTLAELGVKVKVDGFYNMEQATLPASEHKLATNTARYLYFFYVLLHMRTLQLAGVGQRVVWLWATRGLVPLVQRTYVAHKVGLRRRLST